jgi:hypothetical protein
LPVKESRGNDAKLNLLRNVLDATPKAWREEVHARTRACLDAPDPETARLLLNRVLEDFESKAPKAMVILEDGFDSGEVPETASDHQQTGASERGDSPS